LKSLLSSPEDSKAHFSKYIACVHSESSEQRLSAQFPDQKASGVLTISRNDNVKAIEESGIIILGVDPSAVESTLKQDGIVSALKGKLLISVAAGWSRKSLENLVDANSFTGNERIWVLRTLPNICAQVSHRIHGNRRRHILANWKSSTHRAAPDGRHHSRRRLDTRVLGCNM
jgi:pyrroline-5-carboxylate reductase